MKYCLLLWSHLSLLLFLIFQSRGYLITRASSCPTYCGDTLIPYPFGIGDGCYLDEWFEIQCKNSTFGKLVAYLPKIKKEVVSINLPNPKFENSNSLYPYGKLRIKTSITSTGCSTSSSSNRSRLDGEVLNFTGSPFTIGPNNILVAVGCDNEATVTKLDAKLVGCMSSCKYNGEYKSNCNGDRCCQADIPVTQRGYDYSIDEGEIAAVEDGIQVIGVSIGELMANQTGRGSCRVAFLTDEFSEYPESILTNPMWFHNQTYATVQLRWVFPKMNLSFIKSLGCEPRLFGNQEIIKDMTCQCKRISQQSDMMGDPLNSTGGSCKCSRGYEGNPFLPGGCTDINECKLFASDGKSKYCSGCVNTLGSFHCGKKGVRILKIIVGFIGGFGMLIFTIITFWLFKFIERRRKINRKKKYFKRNGGLLLQQQLISREGNVEKTKVFNSKELEKATENFSSTRVLGEGGQGTVYKGMLVDGRIVAIKKSKVKDEDKIEEFINEVVILSEINHRNIVKLLGCCLETEVPLLVYEFIPNGNLFEHLHDESDDYTLATWEMRLRIALDIAEAVSYLHSAAASPIYHRDIKTMNIMLDEKYRAKVSDFGTSRSVTVDHTHLTTVVSGTAGYLDPEYYQSSQFTDKSDVYSFGVVLVELITGQQPISVMRSPENKNLVTYFNLAMKENKLVDIIDARIRDGCKLEQVIATAHLAKRCLNLSGKRRPNMRAVAMELERIRSPDGNSQSHAQIVEEDDEEEVAMDIKFGVESYDNIGVTAPSVLQDNTATTAWLDAEPLFPRQTW